MKSQTLILKMQRHVGRSADTQILRWKTSSGSTGPPRREDLRDSPSTITRSHQPLDVKQLWHYSVFISGINIYNRISPDLQKY